MATLQSPLFAETHSLWSEESNTFSFGTNDDDSFQNTLYENVMVSLEDLMRNEFNIPVIDEHRGNQSFVLNPLEDNLIDHFANAQSRGYVVNIMYTLTRGGGFKKAKENLISTAENVKRLIHNNAHYSPSGVYKYHDGRIESVEYEQDEENLDIFRANLAFNCTVMEVYI